jgi:putative acetyltransferase
MRVEPAVEMAAVQELWEEYWQEAGLSREFQGFADEVQSLPGQYGPPQGRLLIAWIDHQAAGTVAMRPLRGGECEAKRLFVRPAFRGQGVGKALLVRLLEEARTAGYRCVFADTLPSMAAALPMYRTVGFEETVPYTDKATPGAIYMRADLT